MTSYQKNLSNSIISNPSFNIKSITDIEDLGTCVSNEDNFNLICLSLKDGKLPRLPEIEAATKPFDDLTIISFKDQDGKNYYGVVYDSRALEQNPKVVRIYPFISMPII